MAQPVMISKEARKIAAVIASRFDKRREGRAVFANCLLFSVIVLHRVGEVVVQRGDQRIVRRLKPLLAGKNSIKE